ncbi:UbiA family prenyltransferase [Mesorhizobium sp. M0664]|uniref:UbiA family prenyltransferase n=1 Tax=Mesorhizobium sp. M0664 TaxID=2956982 RepID=UPI00333770A1
MSTIARPIPALSTLVRLGRISNLPTVWTNAVAALTISGSTRPEQLVLLLPAMTTFYVGGMYLNDFFDRTIDARDRPGRPIDAGEITAGAVCIVGFGLLMAGVALMIPFGPAAAACGVVLATIIVLYDVWHKGNPLSPIIMGLCRALVYVGIGVAMAGTLSTALSIGALALALHVAGITYAAKQEELNRIGHLWPLLMLAAPLLAALPAANSWLVVVALVLLLAVDASAIRLLASRPGPRAVPLGVSRLIAAISLVDAVAVAWSGGSALIVALCALGYPLTRASQKIIPGT